MLEQLGIVYGVPDSPDPVAFLGKYAELLKRYSTTELEAGADRLISQRKFKSWPTVAECIAAVEDYRQDLHSRNAPEFQTKEAHPDWSQRAIDAADDLINCDMGRKAAREGWVLGLHDYCRANGALPEPREIVPMMNSARYIDRCAAGVEPMGLLAESLQKMAAGFLAKREKLAKRVLGEAA